MRSLLLAALALLPLTAKAEETSVAPKTANVQLLNVEYFDITYAKFRENRDPYTPEFDGQWKYRLATNFRISLGHLIYWDNQVHTEALTNEVKTVGWHYFVGIRLHSKIDLYWEHHSRHVMEEQRPKDPLDKSNVFPVEDSVGIRFKFIEDNTKNSLFK